MTEIVVRPYRAEDFSQVVEIAANLLVGDKEVEYWICLGCESDRYARDRGVVKVQSGEGPCYDIHANSLSQPSEVGAYRPRFYDT